MPLLMTDRACLTSPLPLLTAAEARMLGIALSPRTHHRVRAGVYVDLTGWQALSPWQRYEVRVHAFVRARPDAVLSHESAAVVWGVPLFGETRDIHVYDPDRTASRHVGDVFVHASVDPRDVACVAGLLVTSLMDTVVDLTRALPPAHALAAGDAVVSPAQGGALQLDELRDRAQAQSSTRGRARLRWLWSRIDGLAESPGESVSRAVIEWSGFETPELQQEFRYEGHLDRADFHFPSVRAVGESDGWGKYTLLDAAEAARRLAEEKRREDRLRRHRHPFARWDLGDAYRVTPLCAALHSAGVPLVRPAQPAMLATLRDTRRRCA